MRSEHIDFCNRHQIQDGVLRSFLVTGRVDAALNCLDASISRAEAKVIALNELKETLQLEVDETYAHG